MKKFLFFLLLISMLWGKAQTYEHDILLYTGIELNKDLPKGFDISVEYQLRLQNYLHSIKGSYFYGTLQYSIIKKHLSAELEYRYSTSVWQDQHRFGIGLNGKYEVKKVAFSDRVIYEREHEYFNSAYEEGHEPGNYIRNRFQIKWDFKKRWDVYVSCEPFFNLFNRNRGLDRVRTVGGLDWEFKKRHTLNIFYYFQTEFNQSEPKQEHVIGLMYEWDLPKFKKKKNK